jgi:uncharacterized SAM-binding protein YcdF (DUF218 family)
MTMLLLFLFLILALILSLLKFSKATAITLLITLLLMLFIGSGLASMLLIDNLALTTPSEDLHWGKRNGIILLGAGNVKLSNEVKPNVLSYSRIFEAAKLYALCKKNAQQCLIIASGGDPLHTNKSEAVAYKEELAKIGVNPADIITESISRNTFENAKFTAQILKTDHFDHLYLVTSGVHMKRSLLFFSYFGINPIPMAADYLRTNLSLIPLSYNFAVADWAIHEYLGIRRFYFYNYMEWNSRP